MCREPQHQVFLEKVLRPVLPQGDEGKSPKGNPARQTCLRCLREIDAEDLPEHRRLEEVVEALTLRLRLLPRVPPHEEAVPPHQHRVALRVRLDSRLDLGGKEAQLHSVPPPE